MPASADPATPFQSVQESSSAVSRSKATASYLGMAWMAGCAGSVARLRPSPQRKSVPSVQAALLVFPAAAAGAGIVAADAAHRIPDGLVGPYRFQISAGSLTSRRLAPPRLF